MCLPSLYSVFLLICGIVIFALILIIEIIDINAICLYIANKEASKLAYGYDDDKGPETWHELFPESSGSKQSPINICSNQCMVVPAVQLSWSQEYAAFPSELGMSNNGHCVTLYMGYPQNRPTISCGPLKNAYELYSIKFRWGTCDMEGSEHTINYNRYAFELQAIHVRQDINKFLDTEDNDNIVIISYLFEITPIDNPYLEPLISKLKNISYPGQKCTVDPFPICWLMPAFFYEYYCYQGSLTYPPCTEGVTWIVLPESLAISARQVRKFRKLYTTNGDNLLQNARPLQKINNREIFYYSKM